MNLFYFILGFTNKKIAPAKEATMNQLSLGVKIDQLVSMILCESVPGPGLLCGDGRGTDCK